jgi:hypothetical protein
MSAGRFHITVSGKPRKNPDINGLVQVVILLGRQLAKEETEHCAQAGADAPRRHAGEPPTGEREGQSDG